MYNSSIIGYLSYEVVEVLMAPACFEGFEKVLELNFLSTY